MTNFQKIEVTLVGWIFKLSDPMYFIPVAYEAR